MTVMRVGSLFTGIGGIDLGLERAGMEIKWQVEIDDYCRRVLRKHWPDVERFEDVRTCEPGAVDLICAGFPCQPVSTAGIGQGDADDRWLWPETIRVIRVLHPRWVLLENVPGLLTADGGRLFGDVLAGLADAGFDAWWTCLSAAAVGAPHIRDRVFVVAHAHGGGLQGGGEPQHDLEQRPPRRIADGLGQGGRGDGAVADAGGGGLPGGGSEPEHEDARESCETGAWWAAEPDVGRVATRVPSRVDRLRSLGNAVVPQCAQVLGRMILESDRSRV